MAKKSSATKKKTKTTPKETQKTAPKPKSDNESVIIAVVSTVLVCLVVTIATLFFTGIIKIGDGGNDADANASMIVDNPDKMPRMGGNLVGIGSLQFYLPHSFKEGGKNSDGAFTYNLENDNGWAQVLVYVEKSSLTPEQYLTSISDYLEVKSTDYKLYGTTWAQAENANALAYATKLDGVIYAVFYNVKLDSAVTAQAMTMIPKTLYMKKIYLNE